MRLLAYICRLIDGLNRLIGRSAAWLILVSILVSATNAVIRKAFSTSSNAWLELQWYLFTAVVLLCAAHAVRRNAHVRIDILASGLPMRARLVVDFLGHALVLIPLCVLLLIEGIPFFTASFAIGEMSNNAGGLAVWPVKLMVPLGFFLLLLQALSECAKIIAALAGRPLADVEIGLETGDAS